LISLAGEVLLIIGSRTSSGKCNAPALCILNEILSTAKVQKGTAIVQLDVSKAFDTIPHQAFEPVLQKHGIPASISSV
jgi:positive regulator of sigma E activity